MLMVCERCGAPLDVAPHATMARCAHCGVQTRLREPVAQPPSPHTSPRNSSGKLVALLITGMIALGAAATVVVLSISGDRAATHPAVPALPSGAAARVPPQPRGPTRFAGHPAACLLDANGDGTHDLLGFGGVPSRPDELLLIDGASGSVLWSGGPQPERTQLACLGRDWFVLVEPSFQAQFFQARNLGASVRVLLRDKLSEYGMGDGCARLVTDDGSVQGVALPTGTAVSCKARTRRYYADAPGILGLTDDRTELTRGERTYRLEKRRSGTKMLTVRVSEKGKTLWSRELPYAAPTFSSGLVVVNGTIALWAAEPGRLDVGLLVGLDEATGEQRYVSRPRLSVSNTFGFFGTNERHVVLQVWTSLLAFEPESGKLAWQIGPG